MLIRIYQLTMLLLPGELRRKHGTAMETLFARELDYARDKGRAHEMIAAATGVWDVIYRSAYELSQMKDMPLKNSPSPIPATRVLLRRHAQSFGIAFGVLTALLLLQFMLRQGATLSAQGASASTIAQALVFAIPFISAMTIPMSVLVSVLYEFTKLGKDGSLAAVRSAPDGVRRLVFPVLVAAACMTAFAFVVTAEIVPRSNEQLASVMAGAAVAPGARSMTIGALREAADSVASSAEPGSRSHVVSYQVEIQKKLALPAACLVLALAGMALAFRVPRGGMVLVIGGSLVMFSAYYGLIMTGETLADRMVISPLAGMWGANVSMLTIALLAGWRRREALVPRR